MARLSIKEKERRERLKALGAVADEIEGFDQGRDVLTEVRSVPTVFPQFDIATRVRGYPIQRICLVHGPSNEGKTLFLMGLGLSFLQAEHFYFHVDAEFTTPAKWVQENMGPVAQLPTFRALRPRNYEHVADTIRDTCAKLVDWRASGRIPEHTTALFGIDSIQKLVPQGFFEKLAKDKGIDPLAGRGGQVQAMLHAAWMKELVPLMFHANAAILLISRESENIGATMYEKQYKVGGGKAPIYDSSLVCRITRASKGWTTIGSGDKAKIIGERHLVQIWKTKVGHKDGKNTLCYFHTSNGVFTPAGFDTARDLVEMGLACKVLKKQGNSIVDADQGEILGSSRNDAVKTITDNPLTLKDLRDRIMDVAVPEEEEAPE